MEFEDGDVDDAIEITQEVYETAKRLFGDNFMSGMDDHSVSTPESLENGTESFDDRLARLEQLLESGNKDTSRTYSESDSTSQMEGNLESEMASFEARLERLDRMLGQDAVKAQSDTFNEGLAPRSPKGVNDSFDSMSRLEEDDEIVFNSSQGSHGGSTPMWTKVNRELEQAGFDAIPILDNGTPDAFCLATELRKIVLEFDRRGSVIEDLSAQCKRLQSSDEHSEDIVNKLRQSNEKLRQRLQEYQNRELLSLESRREKTNKDNFKELQLRISQLEQKLQMSEHRVRSKEAIIEKMQEKLQSESQRVQNEKQRSKNAFHDLTSHGPRLNNAGDQLLLESIKKFENARAGYEEEVKSLHEEIKRLNREVRDRENVINGALAEKLQEETDAFHEKAYAWEVKHKEATRKLSSKELEMSEKMQAINSKYLESEARVEELLDEIENLKMEIRSRPTVRDWKASQVEIERLEHQLAAAVDALEESEISDSQREGIFIPKSHLSPREKVELYANRALDEQTRRRQNHSTVEMIQEDKRRHRMGLSKVTALPKSSAHDLVMKICSALGLSEPGDVLETIEQMCGVVRAMEPMEQFVQQVTNFVMLHFEGAHDQHQQQHPLKTQAALDAVIPQLRIWVENNRMKKRLVEFYAHLRTILSTMNPAVEHYSDDEVLKFVEQMPSSEDGHRVSVSYSRETTAEASIRSHPENIANRCVTLAQELFNVKRVEGLPTKLNELYVYVNEMTNFMKTLRPILGLPPNAKSYTCMNVIQDLVANSSRAVPHNEETLHNESLHLPQWRDVKSKH